MMTLENSSSHYGIVSKSLHWLTALLIFTAIPLGIVAQNLPYDTSEELAQKAWIFSLHKTVGVTIFFVALFRILWAFTQPKPAPLHKERRFELLCAETIHWALYASLVLVPLTGWIHHAATTGFAPILWPLGQGLPFVPKNEPIAEVFSSLHIIFERVLVFCLLLHIAGAMKHAVIDRDSTLARMWFGVRPEIALPPHKASFVPPIMAILLYAVALGIGAGLGMFRAHDTQVTPLLAETVSDWQVTEGSLEITVDQLQSAVTGRFADWTAAITFDPESTAETLGDVEVTINIASLTLGSITTQALGTEFFSAQTFPTAVFQAPITRDENGDYFATGTLRLKGTEVPVRLPFSLSMEGDRTTMSAQITLDRRDFNIGPSYPDESTVGFGVDVDITLSAVRLPSD